MSSRTDRLLGWFASRQREVPGRGERDPYRLWVAEVMAQQTRVTTVVPYYRRFLERFPDVSTLAAADLDSVLKVWEGLGYYGRARNLHRAARELVAAYGGALPADVGALRSLPGIGRYTAGALASIAFGLPEPAVDGNARRVLCRLFDLDRPGPARLENGARLLIAEAGGEAAVLNQALMDLGASICTPRSPGCAACPLADGCLALERGTVDRRPERRIRRPIPHHDIGAAIIWHGGRVLITRRPDAELLGGLWEFPGGKVKEGETPAQAARREVMEELGIVVAICGEVGRVRHTYSHMRITLHLFHALATGPEREGNAGGDSRWVRPPELTAFAFPAANRDLIRRLAAGDERLHRDQIEVPR